MASVASRSVPGRVYEIRDGMCQCPSWTYRKRCRHIEEEAAREQADREQLERSRAAMERTEMTQAVATKNEAAATIESVVINGDLSKLQPAERVVYYRDVCDSLGLNPLTKPFMYITLNGRLVLYATRDATDQLRASRGISVEITAREWLADAGLYVVTALASVGGRTDSSIGAVNVKGLQGENLANALMKAETKAKRRVTLSIAGLGMLDETEVASIPDARVEAVDMESGEISPKHSAKPPLRERMAGQESEPDLGNWNRIQELMGERMVRPVDIAKAMRKTFSAESVDAWCRENNATPEDLIDLADPEAQR